MSDSDVIVNHGLFRIQSAIRLTQTLTAYRGEIVEVITSTQTKGMYIFICVET
jgi:hypothetical protein